MTLLSPLDKSISIILIIIPGTYFKQHSSLQQWRSYRHTFHVQNYAKTWRTSNARPTTFQLLKNYPLLCIIFLLPLQKFCNVIQCPYHAWKYKMMNWCTNFGENASILANFLDSYMGNPFYIHTLNSSSILFGVPFIKYMFINLLVRNLLKFTSKKRELSKSI